MRPLPLILAAALLAPGAAFAAEPANLAGLWHITTMTVGMPIKVDCKLTQAGAALSGTCGLANDARDAGTAIAGVVDGAHATWGYEAHFQTMVLKIGFDGQVKSAKAMDGTMTNSGMPSPFTAVKE